MPVWADIIGTPTRKPSESLTSELDSLKPKLGVGKACRYDPDVGAEPARIRDYSCTIYFCGIAQ